MIFDYNSYANSPQKDLKLIKAVYDRICEWTECAELRFNLLNVTINQSISYDVIRKSYEDMLRYRKQYNSYQHIDIPDHFKEAAHLAYWIRRLKPFGYEPDKKHPVNLDYQKEFIRWINERFALLFSEYICVRGEEHNKNEPKHKFFPHKLREDLLHMFRYKHVSPHALVIILRSTF
ncbi:MAG: hypothetical protein Q7T83_03880 [Thermodesulfovibrionales bacterium]|nr:hypothetical protein [Thermodesulfovibrionales bacterium]MDP3111354.1 hypothetical protein [Thermodesulfovibrionales bacterium]